MSVPVRVTAPRTKSNRAFSLVFLITLATAMAITLAMLAGTLAAPRQASDQATAARSVIHRFYAASNVVLATGNTSAFDEIVVGQALIGSTLAHENAGLTALANRLKQIGIQHPGLELTVSRLVVDRDQAVADIELSGTDEGLFSASLEGETPVWRDWFRLRDGKVSAVDGAIVSFAGSTPLINETIQVAAGESTIVVARLHLEPGAWIPVILGTGATSIRIETGEVEFRIDGAVQVHESGPDPIVRQTLRFTAGQLLSFNAAATFGMANKSTEPADVFLVTVIPGRAPILPPYPNSERLSWQALLWPERVGVRIVPRFWEGGASMTLLGRHSLDLPIGNTQLVLDELRLTPGAERLSDPSIPSSDAEIVTVVKGTVVIARPLVFGETNSAPTLLTGMAAAQVANGAMGLHQIGPGVAEVLVIRLDAIDTPQDPGTQPSQ